MKERFLCNRVFSLVLLAAAVLIGGFLPQVKSAHAATVYASGTISTATTGAIRMVYSTTFKTERL